MEKLLNLSSKKLKELGETYHVYEKLNTPEYRILIQLKMLPHLTEKFLDELRNGLNPKLLMGVQGEFFQKVLIIPAIC